MKILLSAYACEPNKGSEPAVGWQWMLALANQGHYVTVITRENNRSAIELEIAKLAIRVQPVYFDLPAWCRQWKHWPGGLYLYYFFWQLGAYLRAKAEHRKTPFDVVHHITFVTFRQPSFMGCLGIPFILGPIGGGESSPRQLRNAFSFMGKIREYTRSFLILLVPIDPFMNFTFSRASLIACTTNETLQKIPKRYHSKCLVLPAIGITISDNASPVAQAPISPSFLFIGRLLYWKGLHLLLRAFPAVLQRYPNTTLTIIGEGEDAAWLKHIALTFAIDHNIRWISQLAHNEISSAYLNHTAFVFPSLHDSGGLVVLESLAAGLPVICLRLGGPGVFVDSSCGISIDPTNCSEDDIQQHIADAMLKLIEQPQIRQQLSAHCRHRASQYTWQSAADVLYSAFHRRNPSS